MSQAIARSLFETVSPERSAQTARGFLPDLIGTPPVPRTSQPKLKLLAVNNEASQGSPAEKTATPTQVQEIERFMQQLRLPVNQQVLARDYGVEAAAGMLTYFQGGGGIRTLDAKRLNGMNFYFREPHSRNLDAMTAKVIRGESSTPGAKGVPALVRGLQVGTSISYADSNNALVDGHGKTKSMNSYDRDHYPLIGAWTISDHASVVVSRPSAGSYEVTVKSTAVAVDKYDWNTGDGDQERITVVFDQDGAPSALNHAQMAAAKQHGAKDFWLSGALTTETKYKLPASVMKRMLAGEKIDLKRYGVSNRMVPITDAGTLRQVITRAYTGNTGKARSAAVPPASAPIRVLVIPPTPPAARQGSDDSAPGITRPGPSRQTF